MTDISLKRQHFKVPFICISNVHLTTQTVAMGPQTCCSMLACRAGARDETEKLESNCLATFTENKTLFLAAQMFIYFII